MRFDLMRIIFMIVAIFVGNMFGNYVAGMVGFGSGLVGSFIIGLIIYAIYTLITGGKINIKDAVIFSILVYIATLLTSMIASYMGVQAGLIATVLEAVVLSFLWGYFGKGQSDISLSSSSSAPRKKGRRKKR